MKKEIFDENNLLINTEKMKCFFSAEKVRRHSADKFMSPCHYNRYYEVYYLIEGCSTHLIDKNKYVLKQGDWIFVPCNVEHRVLYDTTPHEWVLLSFSKKYISPTLLRKMNLFYSNPVYVPCDKDREVMDSIAFKLLYEYKNPDKYSDEIYKNLLFEIMVHFARNFSNHGVIEKMDLITENTINLDFPIVIY